jgi:hypothetical protein
MPDLAEIARRAGVTEAQARAVLAAEAALREPAPVRVPDAAAWAATAVVVVSVAVFVVIEGGVDEAADHKGAVLGVALAVAAGAVAAALLARRRAYRLGEQLGFTVAAALVPVIVWTLLWVTGLWPGRPGKFGEWVGVSEGARAGWEAVVAASAAVALAYPALRLRGALAWGVWLAALQALVGTLIVAIDPDIELSNGVGTVLAGVYVAVFAALALALERRARDWATWTWPYVWFAGAPGFVTALADVTADGVAWAAGLALVVAAAVAGGMLKRVQLVVAAVLGGLALDIWLYELLDIGAGGALVVSLLIGLAVIGLTVVTWRRLSPPAGIRSSS